jgi:hypothetical protein
MLDYGDEVQLGKFRLVFLTGGPTPPSDGRNGGAGGRPGGRREGQHAAIDDQR